VDTTHTTATFRVTSFGRTVAGTVPVTSGAVDIGRDGLPATITGSLDLGAIDTGNARRDRDLRKPRFLDLDRHPTMTFAAGTITAGPAGWRIAGTLTVRETILPVVGDAEVTGRDSSATLTARTSLDRRALGIRAPRIMIGQTVTITVTAVLRPSIPQ
jgi:polyisoprenoid-binding protein YceI